MKFNDFVSMKTIAGKNAFEAYILVVTLSISAHTINRHAISLHKLQFQFRLPFRRLYPITFTIRNLFEMFSFSPKAPFYFSSIFIDFQISTRSSSCRSIFIESISTILPIQNQLFCDIYHYLKGTLIASQRTCSSMKRKTN